MWKAGSGVEYARASGMLFTPDFTAQIAAKVRIWWKTCSLDLGFVEIGKHHANVKVKAYELGCCL